MNIESERKQTSIEHGQISVEVLNLKNINEMMNSLSEYADEIGGHKPDPKIIKKFAVLSAHNNKSDKSFTSYFEELFPIRWVKIYKEKADNYFDGFENRAKTNLDKLVKLKDSISALITHEKEGVVWTKFQKIRFWTLICLTFILALLFSSVSFFAILYSSWDGVGDPYIRQNALDYLPAFITALFASTGGVLLKASTNLYAKEKTIETIVKRSSILLIVLIPVYVSLIISVVSGGEFSVSNNNDVVGFFKSTFNSIYSVIIIHITLEMIMVFLAIHLLEKMNNKRRRLVVEENYEYKKVIEYLSEQEHNMIKYMSLKADLEKIIDKINSNRSLVRTEYLLIFSAYKKRIELRKVKSEKDKTRDEITERRLERDLDDIESQLNELKV